MDVWERIRLCVRDKGIPVGPRLAEDAVERFEQEHRIRLPEEYRRFLLAIGNGCVGPPHCGLMPLGKAWDLDGWSDWGEFWSKLPVVAEPFPFSETRVWVDDEPSMDFIREQVWKGSLYLGSDGCDQGYHLIVTGPERGRIWSFTHAGIYKEEFPFLDWFTDWAHAVTPSRLASQMRRLGFRKLGKWLRGGSQPGEFGLATGSGDTTGS